MGADAKAADAPKKEGAKKDAKKEKDKKEKKGLGAVGAGANLAGLAVVYLAVNTGRTFYSIFYPTFPEHWWEPPASVRETPSQAGLFASQSFARRARAPAQSPG